VDLVEGFTNSRSCGAEVVLEGPGNIITKQALKFEFKASNNHAEYKAIIAGLNLAIDLDVKQLLCKSNSHLVVGQLKDEFDVRETLLEQYYHFVKNLFPKFSEVIMQHIRREHNTRADALSRLETTRKMGLHRLVMHITLTSLSVGLEECMTTEIEPNWMTPIKKLLVDGTCEAHCEKEMKQQASRFLLINEDLYLRGYTRPLLKCLTPEQAAYVIREIHEGVCSTHS